jgi:hypothetical protein
MNVVGQPVANSAALTLNNAHEALDPSRIDDLPFNAESPPRAHRVIQSARAHG